MLNQILYKATILSALVSSSQQVTTGFTEQNLHHASIPYVEGQRQSPIDIVTTEFDEGLTVNEDKDFSINVGKLSSETMKVIENRALEFEFEGYFYDLHYTSSLPRLWYPEMEGPMTFTPKQIHFHMGNGTEKSEHAFDGKHYDLEMHIVNVNQDTSTQDKFKAAVIGFLFEVDEEKTTNSFADDFFENLMNHDITDKMRMGDYFLQHVNMNQRYMYRGSLTTPPYSELLFWTVIPEIIPIKQSTLDLFLYKAHTNTPGFNTHPAAGADNRDVQPLNGRRIYKLNVSENPMMMILKNMSVLLVLITFGLFRFAMSQKKIEQNDDDFQKVKCEGGNYGEYGEVQLSSSLNKTPQTAKEHDQQSIGYSQATPNNDNEGFQFPTEAVDNQDPQLRRASTIDFTKFTLSGSRRVSINIKGDGAIDKNDDHMDQSFHFDQIPESHMEDQSVKTVSQNSTLKMQKIGKKNKNKKY